MQWPLNPVPAGISAASLSLAAMVHGPANHLFIRLHNSGRLVGLALARASSPSGSPCLKSPPQQRLPLISPGPSTQLSSHCSPPCRSPPTAGPCSPPLMAAAVKSTTYPRVSENLKRPTASAWMPPAPRAFSAMPCAPTPGCSAGAAGSASPPA